MLCSDVLVLLVAVTLRVKGKLRMLIELWLVKTAVGLEFLYEFAILYFIIVFALFANIFNSLF